MPMIAKVRTHTISKNVTLSTSGYNLVGAGSPAIEAMTDFLRTNVVMIGADDSIVEANLSGDVKELVGKSDTYRGRTVIIASGANHRQLGIPSEPELVGHGISYCATCDGNFFAGKRVAVYIDTVAEWDDVEFLAAVASSVDVFCRADVAETLPSALPEKVTLHDGVKILEILGDSSVSEINTSRGTLPVNGVFLLRAVLPPTHVVDGLTVEDNHIKVDPWGATNLPGIFSAGDVTGNPLQIAKAVGDGQTAALAAVAYNSSKKAAR